MVRSDDEIGEVVNKLRSNQQSHRGSSGKSRRPEGGLLILKAKLCETRLKTEPFARVGRRRCGRQVFQTSAFHSTGRIANSNSRKTAQLGFCVKPTHTHTHANEAECSHHPFVLYINELDTYKL